MTTKTCPHCSGTGRETQQSHNSEHCLKHCIVHGFGHGHPVMGLVALVWFGLRKLGVGVSYECSRCGKPF